MSGQSLSKYGPPTSVPDALESLFKTRIVKLTRYSYDTGSDSVSDTSYRSSPICNRDVFAYTAGPLLIELSNGVSVGANSDDTEWGSVILWIERDAQGNETPISPLSLGAGYNPIDACDDLYSDAEACSIVGRTILSIAVYQGKKVVTRPRWPCEVAVRLITDDGDELVLCHGLREGGSDEFSVRTKSRIPPKYFETLQEIYRRT